MDFESYPRALVAQLDRVPDYESGGRWFKSSRVHHFFPYLLIYETTLFSIFFMQATKKHLKKAMMMIVGMTVALIGLIYAMRYAQSQEFRAALELFLNPQVGRSWAWCPQNTSKISWVDPKIQIPTPDLNQVCNLNTESAEITTGDLKNLKPLLVANGVDKSRTLEASADLSLFQIDGLPFRSQTLTLMLRKLNFDFRVQE